MFLMEEQGQPADTLTQLREAVTDISRQQERIDLRDRLVRKALSESTPVSELATITGLTRSWIYQIRGPKEGSISE